MRIKKIENKERLENGEYYQKFIKKGEFLSIQFFCKKKLAFILAICEQLMAKKTKNPFLIESLITKNVTPDFFSRLNILVKKVAKIFKLNGINNLDLIISSIEEVSNQKFKIQIESNTNKANVDDEESHPLLESLKEKFNGDTIR